MRSKKEEKNPLPISLFPADGSRTAYPVCYKLTSDGSKFLESVQADTISVKTESNFSIKNSDSMTENSDEFSEEMESYIKELDLGKFNAKGSYFSKAISLLTDPEFIGYLLLGIGGGLLVAGLSVATAGLIVPAFGAMLSTVIIASLLGVAGGLTASTGLFAINANRFFARPEVRALEEDIYIADLSIS